MCGGVGSGDGGIVGGELVPGGDGGCGSGDGGSVGGVVVVMVVVFVVC